MTRSWRTAGMVAAAAVVVAFAVTVVVVVTRTPASPPTAASPLTATPPATASAASPRTATPAPPVTRPPAATAPLLGIRDWAYQLQDYPGGRLDRLAGGPYQLIVVDLARDAAADYFTAAEIARVRATGKRVLAYFEIGSIENFRPEYSQLHRAAPDLIANAWPEWPGEYFTRYYDPRWWSMVVRPRVDRALRAGFDGVYLDTPLAYEQIDLKATQGRDRAALARDMAALIVRISRYAKAARPGFLIVPQNSPELRHQRGYTAAIDGIGMEELFYEATDERCAQDYCAENLAETRALRAAGKFVLGVDYATRPADVRAACARYATEHFAGTVTVLGLDRTTPPCPARGA
ncbi:endo alpha-1,4 polygalactosaminidase [Actinoplanes subtropicus]|uniref:endo alpha-1,4 polygalactosaminidase n=1 Tax=Actinoplanes subtropicus TaxID=543632 RepID=UPI001FE1B73A|nr:endo alpha-1,4 polygalactosaminidase [Actinoplanes subtropicus]